MLTRLRRVAVALAVAIGVLGVAAVHEAAPAGASYPVGTVITFPNVLAPNGTVSCWENQLDSYTSRIDCVKYNWNGSVAQTWQAHLPPWCKGIALFAGNQTTEARIQIANKFWGEETPNSNMAGGHGGCGLGLNQSGSNAWAHNYVAPAGCTGSQSCTNYVGTLAGGSWWGPNTAQHPVRRSQNTGYNGIQWPNGMTYQSWTFFG